MCIYDTVPMASLFKGTYRESVTILLFRKYISLKINHDVVHVHHGHIFVPIKTGIVFFIHQEFPFHNLSVPSSHLPETLPMFWGVFLQLLTVFNCTKYIDFILMLILI